MRTEIFRMDRVTYYENGVHMLNNFDLRISSGEILGLLPLNSYGLSSLLDVITQNPPLQFGFVFYREKLINNWRHPRPQHNHIGLIRNESQLVEGLSLADNVFVLRSGFRSWYIRKGLLQSQLQPLLQSMEVDIPANTFPENLSPFQRIVTELLRAKVAGYRLIVLYDVSPILSETELEQLQGIIRRCAEDGLSFLYIGFRPEELSSICDRISIFSNGRILQTAATPENLAQMLDHITEVEPHNGSTLMMGEKSGAVLQAVQLSAGEDDGLSFSVYPGECVILRDTHNRTGLLVDILTGEKTAASGELLLCGKPVAYQGNRDIAVIQELPSQSMIFPKLSYFDNLFLCSDHHLPQLWLHSRMKSRLAKEYAQRNNVDLFQRSVESLTELEKYDLVYNRILLQKPKVVLCIRPFKGADLELREHILYLIEQLRKKQIAVVITTVNASGYIPGADWVVSI